ncbi:MAG TPA: ectonucleotide pyrophosphatase/phosphodiesterase [Terriglobales bacterium]|nr:ectonucleotide pyrophosphatase/phosphodiesterase [Terriglobales bacterium]
MKIKTAFFRAFCVILLAACNLHATSKKRTVVVISLDGFPAYALDDPRLPIPTLRKLAREGLVAASMRPVNPTVTWPNHTAIVTGVDASEHKVLYNGLLTKSDKTIQPSIEPWCNKDVLVHSPTIYDIAYQAGLTTAQVDWVAIYGAKTITWKFPELPDPDGAIEKEMITDGMVTTDQLKTFEASSQAWQDEMWTAAAEKILEKHKPNLLLFHLLTLDDTNHEYGPMSPASFTGMALLDANVKRIVDATTRAGLLSRTTFIIVSDHGFRIIKHKIHPNSLLRDKGLLSGAPDALKGEAFVQAEGGTAMVYLTHHERQAELLPELRRIFTGVDGIDHVYGSEDFPQMGLPTRSISDQAPDLVLAATPDYAFANESEGPFVTEVAQGGTHGYVNSDPNMQAIFMASGAGIPKGVHIDAILNLDVAPTIAALLGLEMKDVKGHAIPQIVEFNSHH